MTNLYIKPVFLVIKNLLILFILRFDQNQYIMMINNPFDQSILERFDNKTMTYLSHIPKTAGYNLIFDLAHAKVRIRSKEICTSFLQLDEGTHVVYFRSPRAQVYSQFFECKYDTWGKIATKYTNFPKNSTDLNDFNLWLDHFLDNWTMDKGHFNCYNPYNMQTRYLTCQIADQFIAHGYIENNHFNSLSEYTNQAIENMKSLHFVGIMELYRESFCLFMYQRTGVLSMNCSAEQLEKKEERDFIKQHKVPVHNVDDLPNKVLHKIDRLIQADIPLYHFALKLFLHRIKLLEKETGVRIMSSKVAEELNLKVDYVIKDHSIDSLFESFIDKPRHDKIYF